VATGVGASWTPLTRCALEKKERHVGGKYPFHDGSSLDFIGLCPFSGRFLARRDPWGNRLKGYDFKGRSRWQGL
jgi:hypothetical protein